MDTDRLLSTGPQPQSESAAQAFEALRIEIALMRRAVEGLSAERARLEMPDYAPTLSAMDRQLQAIASWAKEINAKPGIRLTAQEISAQIASAGQEARQADHGALKQAQAQMEKWVGLIATGLSSHRTRQEQSRWVMWALGAGVVIGGGIGAVVMRVLGV